MLTIATPAANSTFTLTVNGQTTGAINYVAPVTAVTSTALTEGIATYAITAATAPVNIATITTTLTHGFQVGQVVTIGGFTMASGTTYNGTFTVLSVPTPTSFTYNLGGPGGVVTTFGTALSPNQVTATFAAHTFTVGQTIVVTAAAPGGFQGTYVVTAVPTATTLTYNVPVTGLGTATTQGSFTTPNTTGTNILAALQSLTVVGNNVTVSNAANPVVSFTGALAGTALPLMTAGNFTNGITVTPTNSAAGSVSLNVNPGGTLSLDSTGTHNPNRIADNTSIAVNGGSFTVLGANTFSDSEIVGGMVMGAGNSTITTTAGTSGALTLTAANLIRNPVATATTAGVGATLNVVAGGGQTLGSATNQFLVTQAPVALNTSGIIKGGTATDAAAGGFNLLTAVAAGTGSSIQAMTTYSATIVAGGLLTTPGTGTENVLVTGSPLLMATPSSLNAILLRGTGISITGAQTLTIASEVVSSGGTNSITANLTFGATDGVIIDDATSNLTLNPAAATGIAGTGGITVGGAGIVNFATAAGNSYTGTTFLNSGTVVLGNTTGTSTVLDSAFGGPTTFSAVTVNGNVALQSSVAAGAFQDSAITINSGATLTLSGANPIDLRGVIAGTGGITVNMAAAGTTATLGQPSGAAALGSSAVANTYSGTTTVTAGTLQLGKTTAVNNGQGPLVVGSGTTVLQLNINGQFNGYTSLTVNGGTVNQGAFNTSLNGPLVLNGGTWNLGTGNQGLNIQNTANGGHLQVLATSTITSATVTAATGFRPNNNTILNIAQGATLNMNAPMAQGVANLIMTKVGGGTINFTGPTGGTAVADTFAGTFYVNAGTVNFSTPVATGAATLAGPLLIGSFSGTTAQANVTTAFNQLNTQAITINAFGALDISAPVSAQTIGTLDMRGGNVTLGGNNLNIGTTIQAVPYNAATTNQITANVNSIASATQQAASTLVTITTVNTHNLQVGQTVTITGVNILGYNGTFTITAVNAGAKTFQYNALVSGLAASSPNVGQAAAGTITLTGTTNLNVADSGAALGLTIGAAIIGGGNAVNKGGAAGAVVGNGTVTLSAGAPNTGTGTWTVNTGKLILADTGGVAIPANLVVGDLLGGSGVNGTGNSKGDVVRLTQPNQLSPTALVTINNSGLLDLNNNNTSVGQLTMTGGTITTGTGTLSLNGNVFGTWNVTNQTPATITGKVSLNGGTRQFDVQAGSLSGGQSDMTINGVISGTTATDGLTKTNGGDLQLLGGPNTYTGTTAVNGGTLFVDEVQTGSAVTVASGAVLAGTGSTGAVTVAAGGSVTAGDPVGTTNTFSSAAEDLSAGGNLTVQITGSSLLNNITADKVLLTGALTLSNSSTLTIDLSGLTTPTVAPIVIVQYGSRTGLFASPPNVINAPAGFNVSVTYDNPIANTIAVSVTAATNPSISVFSGSGQSATVGNAFANPLVARVLDSFGNPVSGITVTFAGPVSGANVTFVGGNTAVTDANGLATKSVVANTVSGNNYTVTASVPNLTPASFTLTNNAAAADHISPTSGSGQNATVNTAFGAALVATVFDVFNNPVPGVSVTFAGPGSGASAGFTGGVTVVTASNGQASNLPTANTVSGTYIVTATAIGVAAPASFTLTNNAGAAASIVVTSGSGQSTQVGTAFSAPLVVTVRDTFNNLVPNANVTFTGPAAGASVTFPGGSVVPTGVNGQASAAVNANTVSGSYLVSAQVGALSPVSFALTNLAGSAASIVVTSGTGQSATVNTNFANPLVATVKDSFGNPVSGWSVTFAGPGAGAGVTFPGSPTVLTDASGQAIDTVKANTVSGSYNVTATAATVGTAASFALTNNAGAADSINVFAGSPQSTQVNTAFSTALVARVLDVFGNVVPGASVTFAAPGSGASGNFSNGTGGIGGLTNGSGQLSEAFTANTITGNYTVTATTPGVATPASFSLTNTAGQAQSIVVASGSGQSAKVFTTFTNPLVVTVADAFGNPVPGATVTYTAPGGAVASATFPGGNTALTNGSGVASRGGVKANTITGSYLVTASVSPTVQTTFTLTNTADDAATIEVFSGDAQSTAVSTGFANPLVALVKDQYGNPVPGWNVAFAAPGSGPSATFTGGANATTDSSGHATKFVTANNTTGSYNVTATADFVSPGTSFALTNTVGASSQFTITVDSGSGQSQTVNHDYAADLVAIVKDQFGNAVPNVQVTFVAPPSGASVSFPSGTVFMTDVFGKASAPVKANTVTGTFVVSASTPGGGAPAAFTLTNTADAPFTISVTSGSNQFAQVNTNFGANLVATVYDQYGNAVPSASVTFASPTLPNAGVTFPGPGGAVVTTDAAGHATNSVKANTKTGTYIVTASVVGAGSPASFTLTNTAGNAASIIVTSGSGQSATVNTDFANNLVATVKDAFSNPVPGWSVTFAGPGAGAGVTFPNGTVVTTDANGLAVDAVKANTVAGANYSVTATANAVATPASFTLTNTAAAANTINVFSGSPQSQTVNTLFAAPLVVQVLDVFSNPVPGASVTFAAPSSGPGGKFSNNSGGILGTTDSSGLLSEAFTANTVAGNYSVNATVAGVGAPATFSLTNTAAAANSIAVFSGAGQSTIVAHNFGANLVARVVDAFGNPVQGVNVTFAGPGAGASASFGGGATVPTNVNGLATNQATANTVAGSYLVTATATGVASPTTFGETNVADQADHYFVSAPATTVAGQGFLFNVEARDQYQNVDTGYAGTVHFSSTNDTQAVLPSDSTLTSGMGTFAATLKTVGSRNLTASQFGGPPTFTGATNVSVTPATAASFTVVANPVATTSVAGSGVGFDVTAYDAYGNIATGYAGTLIITSNDPQFTPPSSPSFGGTGVGHITATFKTVGNRNVTVKDSVSASITGASSTISVTPAAANHFSVVAPSVVTADIPFGTTVTALDPYGNVDTNYNLLVDFTSTNPPDPAATTPAPSINLIAGVGSASTTFHTPGSYHVTAKDHATPTTTGESNLFTVNANNNAATHFDVVASTPHNAGDTFTITVTARDASNNVSTGYTGAIVFSSTDAQAVLPVASSLPNGSAQFNVTLKTAGLNQTISVVDANNAGIAGTSNDIIINAIGADHFSFDVQPTTTVAGNVFSITIKARDIYGNVATGYAGTAAISSDDPLSNPPDVAPPTGSETFTAGVSTFNATLKKVAGGLKHITATDGSVNGTSAGISVTPAAAETFTVSAPPSVTAGSGFLFTVTAKDHYGNIDTNYGGTVTFGSNDSAAVLPNPSTLTAGTGVGTFPATLKTAGPNKTITATQGSVNGMTTVTVDPNAATHFTVTGTPTPNIVAGTLFDFTVTAFDAFENVATGYTGTVDLSTTDTNTFHSLPASHTLPSGTYLFTGAKLTGAGNQTITAKDSVTASIQGTSASITVLADQAQSFTVAAPATVAAGTPFTFTVTAKDQFTNVASGFGGQVTFTSSDGSAQLPANGPLSSGTSVFAATFKTSGPQTITAKQVGNPSVTGTSSPATNVTPLAADHFTFDVQPSTTVAGNVFSITIKARDIYGNVATSYGGTATIASDDTLSNPPDVPPAGSESFTAGVSTFNATLKKVAGGLKHITATDGSVTGASAGISVTPATANHFVYSSQPSTATAGVSFFVQIDAYDPYNNFDSNYGATATISDNDSQTTNFNAPFSGGSTSFLATLYTAGTRHLTATTTFSNDSANIIVSANNADHFVFQSPPSSVVAGNPTPFTVNAIDLYGNLATGYGGNAFVTTDDGPANPPTNPPTGSVTFGGGTATFNVTLKTADGTTKHVTVTDNSVTGSTALTVTPNVLDHFKVTTPGSIQAGTGFNVTMRAEDVAGNLITSYGGTVNISSPDDPSASVPAGSVLFTGGQANFNAIFKTVAGGPKHLKATETPATGIIGISAGTTVTPATMNHFLFTNQPAGSVTAGAPFSVTVQALDPFNNVDTNFTSSAPVVTDNDPQTTDFNASFSSGSATFNVTLKTVAGGGKTVTVNNASPSGTGSSNPITVVAAQANHLSVTPSSGTVTAGAPFGIDVTALDPYGNRDFTYTSNNPNGVTFTSTDPLQPTPASPGTFLAADQGFKSFTASLKKVGTWTISASSTNGPTTIVGTTSGINVNPSFTSTFTVTPQSLTTVAGTPGVSVAIQAKDQFGNDTPAFANSIYLTSNDPNSAQATVGPLSGGTGIFNYVLKTVNGGPWTITATDTMTTATGSATLANRVSVTPAAATMFTVSAPSTATAGVPFGVQVKAYDQAFSTVSEPFGNLDTDYNTHYPSSTVTLSSNDPLTSPVNVGALTGGIGNFSYTLQSTGNFTVTATRTGFATPTGTSATINVLTANPNVTNTTTNEDTKSTTGLVITRQSTGVLFFKITAITNGTLYKNDGTTVINNNDFIPYTDGAAGLKFLPASNLNSPNDVFGFDVQSSTNNNNSGLGGSVQHASITVIAQDDTPSDIALAPSSVPENSPTNTVVGSLSTTDVDTAHEGDSFTYQMIDSAGGRFKIGGAGNAQVLVDCSTPGVTLDFEANTSHLITVRTTDSHGAFFDKVLTIQVTNVADGIGDRTMPHTQDKLNIGLSPTAITTIRQAGTTAWYARTDFGITTYHPEYYNGASGIEWYAGNMNQFGNTWYLLTPDGTLSAWTGSGNNGQQIATVDPLFWQVTDLMTSVSNETLAFVVNSRFGLHRDVAYDNYNGQNEHWLQAAGSGAWFYILPNGQFFGFGRRLATFDPIYWAQTTRITSAVANQIKATLQPASGPNPPMLVVDPNPAPLTNTNDFTGSWIVEVTTDDVGPTHFVDRFTVNVVNRVPTLGTIGDQVMSTSTPSIQVPFTFGDQDPSEVVNLNATAGHIGYVYKNLYGLFNWQAGPSGSTFNWIRANAPNQFGQYWYMIRSNGQFVAWDGVSGTASASGAVLATIDPVYYYQPTLLANAQAVDMAFALNQTLGLHVANNNLYQNSLGLNEKWLQGSDGTWYVIEPNGKFSRWNGGSSLTLYTTFDPIYWTDPVPNHLDRLANAQTPQVTLTFNGSNVVVDPRANFVGDLYVLIEASDINPSNGRRALQYFKTKVTS